MYHYFFALFYNCLLLYDCIFFQMCLMNYSKKFFEQNCYHKYCI